MIVRIATEDQYRLPDADAERLNALDNDAVAAVDADDEDRFHAIFEEMLQLVRTDGHRLGDDELEESDVIIPPPDLSFSEAHHEFNGEGLIPTRLPPRPRSTAARRRSRSGCPRAGTSARAPARSAARCRSGP